MPQDIKPRDFRPSGRILRKDLATTLEQDPKAFDCLIFPAYKDQDETVTVVEDVVGSLDSGERAQSYGGPILGRAMIVPDEALGFEVLSGELANSFNGANQPMNILLSEAVRNYSLIQWKEYADPDDLEPELRTVYVLDAKPIGKVAGSGVIYVCMPMPAMGEVPYYETDTEGEEVDPDLDKEMEVYPEGEGPELDQDMQVEPEKEDFLGGNDEVGVL